LTVHFEIKQRNTKQAMWRGFLKHCPNCGEGQLFSYYTRVNDHCPLCHEALHHQKADDAPPYFTIMAVGHIVVPALLAAEIIWHPAIWLHLIIWLPLTCLLTFELLPRFKGLIIGLQWALRMHGFGGYEPLPEKAI
jgi:uncharacterized protein (DUF983 family)